MASKLPRNAFVALWVQVVFLLALVVTHGAPVAAQDCEDCKIIKNGVSEAMPGAVTPDFMTSGVGTSGAVTLVATPPIAQPSPAPVVHLELFWVKGCGHCEEVLNGILPQMQQKYGPQLEVRLVEVVTMEDISAFYGLAETYGFARGQAAVPFLLVGELALSGEDQITAELPGLIERHLANGGVDWPAVTVQSGTGQPAAVPTDSCDLATPCAAGAGAASKGPVLDAAARAADVLSGAGITRTALALWLVAMIGGGLVAVRAVRRRRRPAAVTTVESGAPAETVSRAAEDEGEDRRS
jgi:hypothetical protein